MNVLIINGSPRLKGNTYIALKEVEKTLNEEGIETTFINIGTKNIRSCIACDKCRGNGTCIMNDGINEISDLFKNADGLVVGSPVYYGNVNGAILNFMQRLFYSSNFPKNMKVGAAVCVARRSGTTASFEEINKFFTISNMPIVSSTYWNNVYGLDEDDAKKDEEGLQTMRFLGKNMAFLIKSIDLGKKAYGLPITKKEKVTNFIK